MYDIAAWLWSVYTQLAVLNLIKWLKHASQSGNYLMSIFSHFPEQIDGKGARYLNTFNHSVSVKNLSRAHPVFQEK